ncbi:MAG TPA: tetratricopeptide repeat protein [Saprospiraceae bacterium]|nr:tetratricopeptide repeat protein [Saprospiraceae bacterium]
MANTIETEIFLKLFIVLFLLIMENCFFQSKVKRLNYEGLHLAKKGKHDEGIKILTQALELNCNSEDALLHRGICYSIKRDYEKAVDDYNRCLSLNPESGRYYYNRGHLKECIGDTKAALKDYQHAIKYNSDNYLYYNYYGRLLASIDSTAAALPFLNVAIEYNAFDRSNVKEEILMLKNRCEEKRNMIKRYE